MDASALPEGIPLSIRTTSLVAGAVGQPYGDIVSAQGGVRPYSWSMDAGTNVQAWLHLDPTSGSLSGTPAATLPATSILFEVRDSAADGGGMASAVLSLRVDECLDGARQDCFAPNVSVCLQGSRMCSSGQWGACVTTAGSAELSACGSACAPCGPGANQCLDGQCACGTAAACSSGAPTCCGAGDSSACTNLTTDMSHCGSCGNACTPGARLNVTPGCSEGRCTFTCSSPRYEDCNRDAGDGCEADLNTQTAACGSCTNTCPVPAGGAAACDAGTCEKLCPGGASLCNSDTTCIPNTDPNNCQSCGKVCPSSPPNAVADAGTCMGDAGCTFTCAAGYSDCNHHDAGGWTDGCETPTSGDMNNCGGCGALCVNDGGVDPLECYNGQCLHYVMCNGAKCYEPKFCDDGLMPPRCLGS